jgi:hypothetical protein
MAQQGHSVEQEPMSQNRPKSSCFVPEFCCIMVDVSIAWQFSTQFNPEGQGKRFSALDDGVC